MLKNTTLIICAIAFLCACSDNTYNLNVNVSHIDVDLTIDRMEQDLFDRSKSSEKNHEYLLKKYNILYQGFFTYMINAGDPFSSQAPDRLNAFTNDSIMNLFNQALNKNFTDFEPFKKELTTAFKHYKYYFPDSTIPIITTFYSNFNSKFFETSDRLGIGIDYYLGKDDSLVKLLPTNQIPQYQKDKMERKYLTADVMYGFLHNRFYEPMGNDFISNMSSFGKILYLLNAMMPETPDHIKLNYTEQEEQWCINNEFNIWKVMINENMIYSTDHKKIRDFTSDGPFTKGLQQESPSRVGAWIGLQIIKDYAKTNDLKLLDVLKEKNIQKILKSYKPNE